MNPISKADFVDIDHQARRLNYAFQFIDKYTGCLMDTKTLVEMKYDRMQVARDVLISGEEISQKDVELLFTMDEYIRHVESSIMMIARSFMKPHKHSKYNEQGYEKSIRS